MKRSLFSSAVLLLATLPIYVDARVQAADKRKHGEPGKNAAAQPANPAPQPPPSRPAPPPAPRHAPAPAPSPAPKLAPAPKPAPAPAPAPKPFNAPQISAPKSQPLPPSRGAAPELKSKIPSPSPKAPEIKVPADLGKKRVDGGMKTIDLGKKLDGGPKRVDGDKKTIDLGKKHVDGGMKTIDLGKKLDGGPKRADGDKKTIDLGKNRIDAGPKTIDSGKKLDRGPKRVDGDKKTIDLDKKLEGGPKRVAGDKKQIDLGKKIAKPDQDADGHGHGKRGSPEFRTDLLKKNPQDRLRLRTDGPHKSELAAGKFADHLKDGHFHKIVDSKFGKKFDLGKQYDLHKKGDVARLMKFDHHLLAAGGWNHRFHGPIDPLYSQHSFHHSYCGPSFFPSLCWFPTWAGWVDWCWHYPCLPICDPRPIFCRPIYCDPCVPWIVWDYPVWIDLPVVTCGTWVDVPTVVVQSGFDLQILAVRFVDPGHPEQELGPRYRVWLRNNSPVAIDQPFNVLAYASNDTLPAAGMPEAGVRVPAMGAGEVQSVDIRLPYAASILDQDVQGNRLPFRFLHVVVDSHREVVELNEANNGAVIGRGDILPVDPASFAADPDAAPAGAVVNIAGEGFGPEAGQVVVQVGDLALQAEILGWYDLGVQVRLPALALAANTDAQLIVVRGDGAAANPLTVTIPAAGVVSPGPVSQVP